MKDNKDVLEFIKLWKYKESSETWINYFKSVMYFYLSVLLLMLSFYIMKYIITM